MKTTINKVWIDNDAVYIQTNKGEIFSEQFIDYPRLNAANNLQRSHFEYDNIGIRWKDLDEDLSYRGFMREKSKNLNYPKIKSINI